MTDDLRVERQLHINDGHNYDMVMIGEDNFIFKNKAVKDFRSSEFIIQDLFLSLEELSYIIPLSSTVKFNLIHD